jgi:hypothetical protein
MVGDHRWLIWQAGAAVGMSAAAEKRFQDLRLQGRPNPLLGGSAFSP